jgi:hypothetical protein
MIRFGACTHSLEWATQSSLQERAGAEYPEDADQPHDVDPRGVKHEREEAEDDHEHVHDVPPAVASGGRAVTVRAGAAARSRGVGAHPLLKKGVNQLTKRFTQSSAVKRAVKAKLSMSKVVLQLSSSIVFPICASTTFAKKFCDKCGLSSQPEISLAKKTLWI